MRFIFPVILSLTMVACSHQGEKISSQTTTTVLPASYAMSVPAQSAPPSNPCAQNVGNILTHLEGLMAKDAAAVAEKKI